MSHLADSCRYAALAFLNGVLGAWGKKELGAWLAGPYADVIRAARTTPGARTSETEVEPVPPSLALNGPRSTRVIAPYAVSRLMREAHDEVIDVLRGLAEPEGGVSFAFGAVDTLVEHTFDGSFETEARWIPRAPARMRLVDRVLSLVAVDYLTRPEDYESSLFVCSRCTLVGFDPAARARTLCRVHSSSGVRFRSEIPPAIVDAPHRTREAS